MEKYEDTIYKFYGSAFLVEVDPDKKWHEFNAELGESKPVNVGKVWVSGDKDKQKFLHIDVESELFGSYTLKYEITDKNYTKFCDYKGNKRRLNLVEKIASDKLEIRKVLSTKYINIRVTPELHRRLSEDAKKSGKSLSDYCRELLQGKSLRAALTSEELDMMKHLIQIRSDVQKYFNAIRAYLKGRSWNEVNNIMIEGEEMRWYRKYINQTLRYLDGIINRQK